jgi:hypothetical protein
MENAIAGLIAQSGDNLKAALLIKQALESHELNFKEKVHEIFQNKIIGLVQNTISGAKYVEEDDWQLIDIPIRKNYRLCIHCDWTAMTVEYVGSEKLVNVDEADKMRKTMSDVTGASDAIWEGAIWATAENKYPGLEKTDDALYYLYELHKIYAASPQAVADNIIVMAHALENIYKENENENRG